MKRRRVLTRDDGFCDGLTFIDYAQLHKIHRDVHTPADLTEGISKVYAWIHSHTLIIPFTTHDTNLSQLQEHFKAIPEDALDINAGVIVFIYNNGKWSEGTGSVHVFLTKYEDNIADTKQVFETVDKQTD